VSFAFQQKLYKMKQTISKTAPSTLKILMLSITISSLALVSCTSNEKKPDDTKDVATEQNDAKFEASKNEKDAAFLVNAAEINLMQIKLGQMAVDKGNMKEVKDLGKMMGEEHTKAMKDLQGLAAKKQVTIPTTLTDNGGDAYNKLMKESGKDFDKEYCDMMVDGHKDAIDKFEKAAANSSDQDIKNWAASMLPSLRTHLDQAIVCQKKCEKY
jgi:putative membrane protein